MPSRGSGRVAAHKPVDRCGAEREKVESSQTAKVMCENHSYAQVIGLHAFRTSARGDFSSVFHEFTQKQLECLRCGTIQCFQRKDEDVISEKRTDDNRCGLCDLPNFVVFLHDALDAGLRIAVIIEPLVEQRERRGGGYGKNAELGERKDLMRTTGNFVCLSLAETLASE
jgi:hypothetical protein